MELEKLKSDYEKLSKKYKLPSFKELNEIFEIEKIEKDSDCLLRVVRKVMLEKIINSLNFLEMLLNPMNVPRLYMGFVKQMTVEDKKNLENMYESLGSLSVESLALEINYNEVSEAKMIKKIVDIWNANKAGFAKIIDGIRKPKNSEAKKEKSYFG